MEKKVYCIISNSRLDINKIKLRRQRFANYLLQREDTEAVIWIYPIERSFKKVETIKNFFLGNAKIKKSSGGKLVKVGIPDSLPNFLIPKNSLTKHSLIHRRAVKDLITLLNKYPDEKVLYYTHPSFPFLTSISNWSSVVYDCSDLWSSSMSKDPGFISKLTRYFKSKSEVEILKKSDKIFATSDFLKDEIFDKSGRKAEVIENGVDFDSFTSLNGTNSDEIDSIPKPRFGYVGGMKRKVDFENLEKLALHHPDWNIVLVGPSVSRIKEIHAPLLSHKNVYAFNSIRPDEVPAYLSKIDIGLLPYRNIRYNQAVFPLKLFEYLASGIPAVGWGLPSTKKYSKEGIYYYTDEPGSIDEISKLCSKALSIAESKEFVTARKSIAEREDWDSKFDSIVKKIDTNR
jgi:teichuronic acid biosynthesis glycosyltransferase TuaH